jgi:hypothetical protein
LSDLALALLEDDNSHDDRDAHAEYLDAKNHGAQQIVVPRHAGRIPTTDFTAFRARQTPAEATTSDM